MTRRYGARVRRLKARRVTRDGVLFVVGLLGILHETFVSHLERPGLLVLFAGMVGLPAFIQRDEHHDDPKPPA